MRLHEHIRSTHIYRHPIRTRCYCRNPASDDRDRTVKPDSRRLLLFEANYPRDVLHESTRSSRDDQIKSDLHRCFPGCFWEKLDRLVGSRVVKPRAALGVVHAA